jgi:agmatine deiminase
MTVRSLPGEWEQHELTLMALPRRDTVWKDWHEKAWDEYMALGRIIAEYEAVLLIGTESQLARARGELSNPRFEFLEYAIDDGWIRDSGPIVVKHGTSRLAVSFDFNSWGRRFSPDAGDRAVARAVSERLGIRLEEVPFVLEGGAISWNGAGTAVVVEECVLHTNRNGPGVSRERVEKLLFEHCGIDKVIWLPYGLQEDANITDGHVDNVAVFVQEDLLLVQMSRQYNNSNRDRLRENEKVLKNSTLAGGKAITIVVFDALPYATMPDGSKRPAPYVNFCLTNGAVILPTVGEVKLDLKAEQLFHVLFPSRAVHFCQATALTFGGGGPHCVTMQWPGPPRPGHAREFL